MALKADLMWTVTSRVTYAFSQWLILVLIARFSTSDQLGEFTYALAVVAPITVFAHLNIRGYMATDATEQFGFLDYLGSQFFTIGLAMLVIVAVAIWIVDDVGLMFFLLLIGLYKSVECVSFIYYGAMQRNALMREVGISVIAHGLIAVAMMAAALSWSGRVVDGIIGIAVAWLAILFVYDMRFVHFRCKVITHSRFNLVQIWKVVVTCLPLGIVIVMLTLRSYIPIYFVKSELSTEQVGIYSVVSYFMVAGSLITGSLLQVFAPRLANYCRDCRRNDARQLMMKMMGIVCAIGAFGIIIAWTLGGEVLSLIYGERFETQHDLLVWVMVSSAIIYASQPLGQLLTVLRSFHYEIFSNGIGIFFIAVFSAWLVPKNGLIGASQALCIGAFAALIAHSISIYLLKPDFLFEVFEHKYSSKKNENF
jgi:O-antigen/teichoic acid export membrane protein